MTGFFHADFLIWAHVDLARLGSVFTVAAVIVLILLLPLLFFLWRSHSILREQNEMIKERESRLRLILDSTAEGIYGVDQRGNCTFCNAACLRILGYEHESDLIGENMHQKLFMNLQSEMTLPHDDCHVQRAIEMNQETTCEDKSLHRADGSSFPALVRAYPQHKDGLTIGAVVSFTDITEKKQLDEKIRYLGLHDTLTGLFNRNYFNSELMRINNARNLPIALIVGDVNGLKLANDIFGHHSGDQLLKEMASLLRDVCRTSDIVARTGGDEFTILMPRTNLPDAELILERIRAELSRRKFTVTYGSIALGCAAKTDVEQDILEIMTDAEEKMYRDKILNKANFTRDVIDSMIEALHEDSPREKRHSQIVSRLCREVSEILGLPSETVHKFSQAGFLHDIGKITLDTDRLYSEKGADAVNRHSHEQHVISGFRILNSFEDTMDLAEIALYHHERWDGSGYPKGLTGAEIPLGARITAIAEHYDYLTNPVRSDRARTHQEAVDLIAARSGKYFDPIIASAFVKMMSERG